MKLKGYFPLKESDLAVMIGMGFFLSSLFSVLWGWAFETPTPHLPSLMIAALGFAGGRLLRMRLERQDAERIQVKTGTQDPTC
ncbi:hypothetical protein [Pseudomonas sp. CFBP 13719]|uniref:hypothetical protein n=1 Tax=Pseudomonas sp. CFBP 13719 TaxID=2775303 RepID=UPI001784300F|nr:hypothetical protein [Pseudomonas sp. CFBP 13719]MBD8614772.1 hypothetical protein [Pseudomonas putida]MBD8681544.1 hypothetical protein [Pseudomonas sp. CFBP 13719]